MNVYNYSTNVVYLSGGWFSGGTNLLACSPGKCITVDSWTPTNGTVVVDDIAHTYVGVIDAFGNQSVQQSWSLVNVFLDGFWWGLAWMIIPIVIKFARKGAKATPWAVESVGGD